MSSKNTETKAKNVSKNKKKKRVSIFRVIILVFLSFFIIGSALGLGLLFAVVKTAQPINAASIQNMLDESSFIYDSSGNLIEKVHGSNYRTIVPLDQIPKHLQEAVIAIEDERFYKHPGVDIKRIGGALLYDIKTRSLAQGASTITMQLAKNLYTSPEKDITRKIKDAYYALEIEKQLNKDQILHAYLNTMSLGRGAIGVQAAAQTYFSKDVSELNLAECAMVAGITKYPYKFSPYVTSTIDINDELSALEIVVLPSTEETPLPTENDLLIYEKALNIGKIDNFEYNLLKKGDVYLRKAVLNPESKKRQETVLFKMNELGYITDSEYQEAINHEIVIKIGKKKEQGISTYFMDKLKQDVITAFMQKGYTEDEAIDILYNGGLRIYSTLDTNIQKILEKEFENKSNFPGSYTDENGVIQPQGAMVIMDQYTGEVRGLVGGRGIGGNRIYNRALNPRQPGSSIKPLAVYLPALSKGITAADVYDDSPREDGKGGYWPKNVGSYYGPSTVRQLLERSSNVGAVKIGESLSSSPEQSINTMISYLQKMGFTTIVTRDQNSRVNDENLSLTLGGMTKGLTPLEITSAYTAIANQGNQSRPIFFTRIENSNGDIIFENKNISKEITDPQTAYILTDMLRTAVLNGSGKQAKLSNITTAGKTGTTSDKKDAWFVGFTPYYTAATWIGTDMPTELSDGSAMSARLWKNVMEQVHKDLNNKEFSRPNGITEVSICKLSGGLLTEACSRAGTATTELFKSGSAPTQYCEIHNDENTPIEEELTDEDLFPDDELLGDDQEDSDSLNNPNPNNGNGNPNNNPNPNNGNQNNQSPPPAGEDIVPIFDNP